MADLYPLPSANKVDAAPLRVPAAQGLTASEFNSVVQNLGLLKNQYVDVKAYGAVGDGVVDDTLAITNAAVAAKAAGQCLFAEGTFLISATVTMRQQAVDFSKATVSISGSSPMLVIGGTSTIGSAPTQAFYSVTRAGGVTSTPTIRVMGSKGQHLFIGRCDYVQLYADTSTGTSGPDASIAYNSFNFDYVTKLELTNNASTPNSTVQWINENSFFLKRASTLTISGTYGHNHNWFYTGTFESSSTIDIQVGNSNVVFGPRFEGGGTVSFGSTTFANKVIPTWESNARNAYESNILGGTVTVSDSGEGNYCVSMTQTAMRRIPVVVVNERTCQTFSNVNGATNFARGPNYTTLRGVDVQRYGADTFHRQANRLVFDSPLIPLSRGEAVVFAADSALFRTRVRIYNSSRVQILDADPLASSYLRTSAGLTWNAAGNNYISGANNAATLAINSSSTVAFVKFDIESGTTSLNAPFRQFAVHRISFGMSPAQDYSSDFQALQTSAVTASPTVGYAYEPGTKTSNTAGGWFTATRALDTTLSVAGAAAAPSVTLTSVTGIASGDVIGISLDSGATHWTTVSGAPAGSVVTLLVALPSAAAISNRVVSNGWTAT